MGKPSSKSPVDHLRREDGGDRDPETPCVSVATRRSRRAPRRALNSSDSTTNPINAQNDDFSPTSSSSNLQQQMPDFAHPAQSLQVCEELIFCYNVLHISA